MELLPPVLVDSVEVVGSGLAVGLVWLVWLCLVWLSGLALWSGSLCVSVFFFYFSWHRGSGTFDPHAHILSLSARYPILGTGSAVCPPAKGSCRR